MIGGYFADLRVTPGRIDGMRVRLCAAMVLLASGCGSAEPASERLERYGISLEAQAGWKAEISRGLVRLAHGDVSVDVYEYDPLNPAEAAHFDGEWPMTLETTDFGRLDDERHRLVSLSGRLFSVFGFGSPTSAELDEINGMLATIQVEPGDFYPGSVAAVEFPKRSGWNVISPGPAPRLAHGESTYTAAATVPYLDEPNALPPTRTLEALPRDGILVWVNLTRDARFPPSRVHRGNAFAPNRPPPYRLADFERVDGWEGQVRDIPDYRLWVSPGDRYLVDVRVYFGRARPSEAVLAEADAVVRTLRFPDWGPWELESA